MFGKLAVGIIMLLPIACSSPEPQQAAATGLRKVVIASPQEVERLRNLGVEIIVQEENYVIIRRDSALIQPLQDAGIASTPIQEAELVQRLVRVQFNSREQLQQIIDMGVDVWETEGDSLTARAYDIHLSRLQAAGIGYRVIAKDASKREGDR